MRAPVYIFDPTLTDAASAVRGIGRYVQILKQNCPPDWIFTGSLTGLPSHAVLVQPFYTFYSQPLITRRVTDRQIAVIHDVIPLKYPAHFPIGVKAFFYSLLQRWNLGLFDEIITDSATSKLDITKYLGVAAEKIKVLYPTLANCFWEANQTQSAPSDYCLYVGDGTWNKNLSTIARAIKRANVTCMFVGKIFDDINPAHYTHPWQSDLQTFFTEANGDKRFLFAGYVTDAELLKLYVQAKLNILLSHDEGFGFSYVEAGSLGCPSLLADTPIFHEIAGENAAFVDQNNEEKIADAILRLMNDEKERTDLSIKALQRSKSYNIDSFKKRLLEVVYPY